MSVIINIKRILNYVKEKSYRSVLESFGEPQYNITEAEANILLFYIDHYEEINKNYGSLSNWEKVFRDSMEEKFRME